MKVKIYGQVEGLLDEIHGSEIFSKTMKVKIYGRVFIDKDEGESN
jgi:hypothetical protein